VTKIKIDWSNMSFKIICVLLFLFLLVPVFVIIPVSFTSGYRISFPPEGFSLKWFAKFFTTEIWIKSFYNSTIIAIVASIFSLILGVTASLTFRHKFSGKSFVKLLVLMPWFTPALLLGVSLLIFMTKIGLYGTYISIMLAHTLWGLPITVIIITAGLGGIDKSLEEAAQSLGANSFRTFFEITLPLIKNSIFASILLSFILSFNEFLMSYFLSTSNITPLPILIWSFLREGFSPIVAAISVVVILESLLGLALISKFVGLKTFYE